VNLGADGGVFDGDNLAEFSGGLEELAVRGFQGREIGVVCRVQGKERSFGAIRDRRHRGRRQVVGEGIEGITNQLCLLHPLDDLHSSIPITPGKTASCSIYSNIPLSLNKTVSHQSGPQTRTSRNSRIVCMSEQIGCRSSKLSRSSACSKTAINCLI
jgi:hypothetical protein